MDEMNKQLKFVVTLSLLFGLVIGIGNVQAKTLSYKEIVKTFETIKLNEFNKKIAEKEEFLVYIGRETCPHCQKFVPMLHDITQKQKVDIVYIESDKLDLESDEFKSFQTQYKIESVPFMMAITENGKSYETLNDTENKKELSEFIKKFINSKEKAN